MGSPPPPNHFEKSTPVSADHSKWYFRTKINVSLVTYFFAFPNFWLINMDFLKVFKFCFQEIFMCCHGLMIYTALHSRVQFTVSWVVTWNLDKSKIVLVYVSSAISGHTRYRWSSQPSGYHRPSVHGWWRNTASSVVHALREGQKLFSRHLRV